MLNSYIFWTKRPFEEGGRGGYGKRPYFSPFSYGHFPKLESTFNDSSKKGLTKSASSSKFCSVTFSAKLCSVTQAETIYRI